MMGYIDKHITEFVNEWGDLLLPQLDNVHIKDLTDVFSKTKKSRIILKSIHEGKKIYIIGFKDCKGMIKKWLYDNKGRMMRENGRGVIEINSSVITAATVDIVAPFVSSDEILSVGHRRDKPYNLEKGTVEEAMKKSGFDPDKDIIFMFFNFPKEIKPMVDRFIDEFKHLITFEYCRAKGILAIKDPKWIKYHASDEITKYTNTYFFGGVRLTYSKRETIKEEMGLG